MRHSSHSPGSEVNRQMKRRNILILDPERDTGELFARALEARKDCKCYVASREEEVVTLLKEFSFELLLVDMGMAMASGFSLIKRIKRIIPRVVIVVDAYLHQQDQIFRAIESGATGHIIKPIKVDEFRKKIDEFSLTAEA
jgi:DNA-binding response OmpR family regulator